MSVSLHQLLADRGGVVATTGLFCDPWMVPGEPALVDLQNSRRERFMVCGWAERRGLHLRDPAHGRSHHRRPQQLSFGDYHRPRIGPLLRHHESRGPGDLAQDLMPLGAEHRLADDFRVLRLHDLHGGVEDVLALVRSKAADEEDEIGVAVW